MKSKKKSRLRKPHPLSMNGLISFGNTLMAWKKSIEKGMDKYYPGWREGKSNIMDMSDGYKMEYQTLRLLQALQVSLLDKMEMTQICINMDENKKRR